MRATRTTSLLMALAFVPGLLMLVTTAPAAAHEERPASFPSGKSQVPRFLGLDNPNRRVVCTKRSAAIIERMPAGSLKRRNKQLLRECDFRSIQTAINSIQSRRTSVYVLPGRYTERRWARKKRSPYCSNLRTSSTAPLKTSRYIGSLNTAAGDAANDPIALSYADQRRCAQNHNLIAMFGDRTPRDKSIACNSRFCGTQIVGTGRRMLSVIIDNRFAKLNAIRADRMGGAYFRNFTIQQAEFNALYILETDGFVVDRVTTRANDEYGILAFASDRGLIKRTNNYYNGDSGIYPGSASDVNGDNTNFKATRYSIKIINNRSHHNTLGYSGTAGNSVLARNNRFYQNATGIATDSLFPDHPGLPQDHARWTRNKIYSNNQNYYEKYVQRGVCDKPMAKRGYMRGVVCPVVPVPVGTGVLIAGGNYNSTDNNRIWNNWRYGTMQFYVPAALRNEPEKEGDTSHFNRTFDNTFGIAPGGKVLHNGMDSWWDDAGQGNCWSNNTSSRGEHTNNFINPMTDCPDGNPPPPPGGMIKDAGFLSCSQYDRNDPEFRDPPECNWFETPPKPTDSSGDPFPVVTAASATESVSTMGTSGAPVALAGLLLLTLALLPSRVSGRLLRAVGGPRRRTGA